MALADLSLVSALIGRDLDEAETDRFETLAGYVDTLIVGECPGLTTSPTDDDTHTVTIDPPRDTLWTEHYPVTAVSSITVDGTAVDLDDIAWTRLGRLTWRSGHYWSGDIVTTYDHGTPPADLAAAAAEVLAAAFTGAAGTDTPASESLGPWSVTYNQTTMMGRLAGQKRTLRRWRRHTATSVIVGR